MNLIATVIARYFPGLTDNQKKQFDQLSAAYNAWNEKINVISRKDIENLSVNHVLHSLGIAKVVSFRPGAIVMDVGTGGGFPGIPLAILFPDTQFHLVDSIGKKITVVKEIANAVGLHNVKAEQVRAEQVNAEYDFIVSRAVTRMKEFYGWVGKKFKRKNLHERANGILYLKGGIVEEEMDEVGKPYESFNLSDFFQEEFFETKKVIYLPCA